MLPALLSSRVLAHGAANICFPLNYFGKSRAGDKKIVRYTESILDVACEATDVILSVEAHQRIPLFKILAS